MVKYGTLQGLKGHIYNQKQQLGVGAGRMGWGVWGLQPNINGNLYKRQWGEDAARHSNLQTAIFRYLV